LGSFISLLMYSSLLKKYLYINKINSNREICSLPSRQHFKCNLYRDGTIVSSSIN